MSRPAGNSISLADGLGNHYVGTDDILWTVLANVTRCSVFIISNTRQTRRANDWKTLLFQGPSAADK